jgi:membrane protein implicated in regulation of membrane protease activity
MLQTLHATWWAWAILVALVMALGGAGVIGAPISVLMFAVISLIATLVLRKVFSLPKGQVKTFDGDIND